MEPIAEWLEKLGLGQYGQRFVENGIDISALAHLTDQDFKDLGVLLGHRRKIQAAIAEFAGNARSPTLDASPEPKNREDAERRHLTVMFTDLVGSTALSTKLDPEDLRSVISAYHRCVAQTVARFDGFVAKYMGDGALIYFGYPQAHEDDAERAVRAGLELIDAISRLASHESLQVRVGAATGLVVVGDLVGSGEAQERGVVGETPNLAARLQTAAAPGRIVICPTTRRLLGNLFEYRNLGDIEVKGFAARVQAHEVIRLSAVRSRFEALRATTTPLVGRDEEVDLLMRRWQQAKSGEGAVVLISGEPGIGKSRIAQTVVERLGAEPHTRLRYFCSPHHQDSALYPSIAQLERAAGFRRDDTDEQRLNKLEAVLAQGTNDLSEAVPLLAGLLSIPTGDRYLPLNLTPQKNKEKTLLAQLAQVEGLAAQQPVLMVWEDVHWSDPTTRESLDLLIDRVPAFRVLVIITFRPEFAPPWGGRPHVTLLSLSRLPRRHRAKMIALVTAGKSLPKEVADQIIDRTDGVPLFIEELTKSVVESGLLTEAGDRDAVSGPITQLAIPTTLHASLLARLDRLAPTREVAQIAAALGRRFSHELLSAVAGMPQQQVDDALAQLVNAELIFRRGMPPDAEYTFKHALVRDAAYDTLLRSRRQQLHGRIVRTLESRFPEITVSQPHIMAQHCVEAGLSDKAVNYFLNSGKQAATRSAMAEAITQLQKGLDLLPGLTDDTLRRQQELDLRIALGPALIATKGYSASDVGTTMTRAHTLAEQLSRSEYFVPLLYGQWGFHLVRAEYPLALSCADQIRRIGEQRNEPATALLGHLYDGIVRFSLGELRNANANFERCRGLSDPGYRAMATATAMTAEDPFVMTLAWLGCALATLGHVAQGRERIVEALTTARQITNAHLRAYSRTFALIFAAATEMVAVSPDTALRHAEDLDALSSEHGFPYGTALAHLFRGWSLTGQGRPREGLTLLTEGYSMCRGIGAVWGTSQFLYWQAEAHGKLGETVEALNCLDEAERFMERTGERFDEHELLRFRGYLLHIGGDPIAAEQAYNQALAIARRRSARLFELRAAASLARLWRDQGKCIEARDLLAPVYGWFTEGLDAPVLQDAKALLDQLT